MAFAKIRLRRGPKTEWEEINPVLMEGEWGVEYPDAGLGTGLCKVKIGNGSSKWTDLTYALNPFGADSINGGTVDDSHTIQLRCGSTAEWEASDPILGISEPGFDISKYAIKIGDGISKWSELEYIGSFDQQEDYDFGDEDE